LGINQVEQTYQPGAAGPIVRKRPNRKTIKKITKTFVSAKDINGSPMKAGKPRLSENYPSKRFEGV
jgi:hypothetical protein